MKLVLELSELDLRQVRARPSDTLLAQQMTHDFELSLPGHPEPLTGRQGEYVLIDSRTTPPTASVVEPDEFRRGYMVVRATNATADEKPKSGRKPAKPRQPSLPDSDPED